VVLRLLNYTTVDEDDSVRRQTSTPPCDAGDPASDVSVAPEQSVAGEAQSRGKQYLRDLGFLSGLVWPPLTDIERWQESPARACLIP
jgi:hypothetical protein